MQGRRRGELALVVEGVSRFYTEKFIKDDPYFEAQVTVHIDQLATSEPEVQALFAELKQLSRELLALIRLSSLLPKAPPTSLSPLLARRLELFIVRKDLQEAGVLADFMANVIECSHEDKLLILSALPLKLRLERAVELLQKNVTAIQGSNRIMSIATTTVPQLDLDSDQAARLRQQQLLRKFGGGGNAGSLPPFNANGTNGEEKAAIISSKHIYNTPINFELCDGRGLPSINSSLPAIPYQQ